ncbi:ribosome maturation factor RimM [Limnochorda pilosa]|uniref:ribosome maturation factor RimM n=1 Tax=Limnochorda pilosa TaxID=1555112 RepID=UPI00130DB557|nr:ribosome maturation factor RimM [Limnochorda pilosa]
MGRVLGPWGVAGWVRVEPLTDRPERFLRLEQVRFRPAAGRPLRSVRVRDVQVQGIQVRLAFSGVETREEALELANGLLQVPAAEAEPLPEGRYYRFQLLGLEVWTVPEGRRLGRVVEVLETGANDVLVVQREEGGEVLLPALRQVVRRVDLDAGRLEAELLPGLEEATGRADARRRDHPLP